MKIELTKEQMEAIDFEKKLIVDNEIWEYISEDGEVTEDANGRYHYYIYQRPSDKKFFRIGMFYIKCGYEDHSFEFSAQSTDAYEVERKEIKKYEWIHV